MNMTKTLANPIRSVREQIAEQLRNEILADLFSADEPMRASCARRRWPSDLARAGDRFATRCFS